MKEKRRFCAQPATVHPDYCRAENVQRKRRCNISPFRIFLNETI